MKSTILCLIFVFISSHFTVAQTVVTKLVASDGESNDFFGYSISLSGDYALIGTNPKQSNGAWNRYKGSVYIFKREGTSWIEQTKLIPSDDSIGYYGRSVSLSSNYALIGAFGNDKDKGCAYIFRRDNNIWTEEDILISSDGEPGDQFGYSVYLSDDYAIIGAHGDDGDKGSAYVFRREDNKWIEEVKLTANDGEAENFFGKSVFLSGDYLIVGSPGKSLGFYNKVRAAYIFKREDNTWTQQAKLIGSYAQTAYSYFGRSVSLSGDYALVGDSYNWGAAYLFMREDTIWSEQAKLIGSDLRFSNGGFGCSVSLLNDIALIGTYREDEAYIFVRDNYVWNEYAILRASDSTGNDNFGNSVYMSGNYAIIGEPYDNDRRGSTYIFDFSIFFNAPAPPLLNEIMNPDWDGTYSISWSKVEGIVDHYILEESDEPSFQNPEVIYTGKDTLKSITGRNIGTYYYRVNATNGFGTSNWSEVKTVKVSLPPAPILNEIENSDEDGIYDIIWTNGKVIVDYYKLEEADEPLFQSPKVIYTGLDTSKSITGKKDTGTYYYRVNATNSTGTSDWSEVKSVMVTIATPPPTTPILYKIENSDGDGIYDIIWSKADGIVDYYTLEESDEPSFKNPEIVYSGVDTFKSITGKDVGTYYYCVNATNSINTSDWSEVRSVTVKVPLPQCGITCKADRNGWSLKITCESGSASYSTTSYQYWSEEKGWVTHYDIKITFENTGNIYVVDADYWKIYSEGIIGQIVVDVSGGIFGDNVMHCQNFGGPNADFKADKTSGNLQLTVQFTDKSTWNISSWLWDFGDQQNSIEQNPTHTYTEAGTYTVSLTVTGDGGTDTETKTDYITVTVPPPIANFAADQTSGTVPMIVNFTDNSTGQISFWLWDYGDQQSSNEQNPTHTYSEAGTFTVSLTVSGYGGTDMETKTNYITVTDPTNITAHEINT
jgi:PKD repeat protein